MSDYILNSIVFIYFKHKFSTEFNPVFYFIWQGLITGIRKIIIYI